MRRFRLLLLAALLPALAACITYRYGDQTFQDRKEAEAAQQADHDLIRKGIEPRARPVAKAGRVVVPTFALLEQRGLRPGGVQEARDYVATVLHRDFQLPGELIRKRNIFEKLEVVESPDGDHVVPRPGEAVIYLYIPDNKTVGWYYLSETTKRTPLQYDRGNPDKVGRAKYFIDSVEALAAEEK